MKKNLTLNISTSIGLIAFTLILLVFTSCNIGSKKSGESNSKTDKLYDSYALSVHEIDTPGLGKDTTKSVQKKLKKSDSKESPNKGVEKEKKKEVQKETTVLVCNSQSSYAYHAYECSGLKRCKSGTSSVTKTEAENMGRRPCKNCY